ncbi:MAG: saccharopine dehydrogenase NADP-binding domain-containing protein [Polyangiaceae bacterium]
MDGSTSRAPMIVVGATGFTGTLVAEALRTRGIPFAIAGRDATKLAALADVLGGVERVTVDLDDPRSLDRAFEGRALVSACAGPFSEVGESVVAAAIRASANYVDTTGEQAFVARVVAKYADVAERRGVAVVPSMAYETAIADWAAHLASSRLSGPPTSLDVVYGVDRFRTTRGTKLSILAALGEATPQQFVDGRLVPEGIAKERRRVVGRDGDVREALSFPSPEAILVPRHTRARSVRTYAVVGPRALLVATAMRGVAPVASRLLEGFLGGAVARTRRGPDASEREAQTFFVLAEAERGSERVAVRATGHDPYGLTAHLHAHAACEILAGRRGAVGVAAPSEVFPFEAAEPALRAAGVTYV